MKTTDRPRIAVVQSHWHGSPEQNLQAVLRLIDGITERVDLICLPEFFLGAPWYFPGQAHLRDQIEQTIPGPVTEVLAAISRRHGCYVLCGTLVERDGDRTYNTSALLDDDGRLVAKARKIHRFSAEMLSIDAGEALVLVDTPFGKLGICVCSDFWIVEMPRMLAIRGAEIIAVPGAALIGNLDITRPCIIANSAFNVCYTIFAGGVGKVTGTRAGRHVSIEIAGRSTVAGPEALLGTLDAEEAVLQAELDLGYLRTTRTVDLSFRRSLYWCLHGRLPHLYAGLTEHYVGISNLETLLRDYLR